MFALEELPRIPDFTERAICELFELYASIESVQLPPQSSDATNSSSATAPGNIFSAERGPRYLGPRALVRFFTELGVDMRSLAALAFAWLGRWQYPCHCREEGFARGVRYALWALDRRQHNEPRRWEQVQATCSTLLETSIWPRESTALFERLRSAFPDAVLSYTQRSAEAALDFYLFAFDLNRQSPYRRSLSLTYARYLWKQFLSESCYLATPASPGTPAGVANQPWRYLEHFDAYLESRCGMAGTIISRDTWYWVLMFARETQVAGSSFFANYNQGDAWPVLLDGFVEYLRENKLLSS